MTKKRDRTEIICNKHRSADNEIVNADAGVNEGDNISAGAARSNLLPVCIICDQTPVEGIRGGILILGKFLCTRCEEVIAELTLDDPNYEQVKEQLKKLWS